MSRQVVNMRSALIILFLLATSSMASASEDCLPILGVDDPRGDTRLTPTNQPYPAPKMDILRYEIERTSDTLDLRLTLAQRPGGEQNEYYRYWLGFHVVHKDKSPEYMDVRIGATSTYDEGDLVGPNSQGNPTLGILPIEWNGSTMVFHIPLSMLEEAFGGAVEIGAPQSSADGIDRLSDAQGFGAPRLQDDAISLDVFEETFPTLRPCLPAVAQGQDEIPATRAETPWPAWNVAVLVGCVLAFFRPRRAE